MTEKGRNSQAGVIPESLILLLQQKIGQGQRNSWLFERTVIKTHAIFVKVTETPGEL